MRSIIFSFLFLGLQMAHAQSPEKVIANEKVIAKVYENLINSIGNLTHIAPELKMVTTVGNVAAFDSQSNTIAFEMKAYEACRSFGSDSLNAIAFILAHELGHVYQNHGWLSDFKSAYASSDFGKELKKAKMALDTLKIYESQADEFACFYATLAGYPTSHLGGDVLDKLYKTYDFSEKLDRYPTLTERKLIVKNSANDIELLIPVFEFSNMQYALGNYQMALTGYTHLLKRFPSREIYNNLGVCYASLACQEFPKDSIQWIVPFGMDWNSRLYNNDERTTGTEGNWEYYFKRAKKNFEACIQLDKHYARGYYNLALVEHFLGKQGDANFHLTKGKENSNTESEISFYYLNKGIISLLNGQTQTGLDTLAVAAQLNNSVAKLNIEIAQGTITQLKAEPLKLIVPLVDGIELPQVITVASQKTIAFDQNPGKYELYESILPASKVVIGKLVLAKNQYYKIQMFGLDQLTDLEAVTIDSFIQSFGNPSKITSVDNHIYLIYRGDNVAVKFSDNQAVGIVKFFDVY
jgi:tetratricopeptide (TPR) repeat protein